MPALDDCTLYAGLTGLNLDADCIYLGNGIVLAQTCAKFLTPLTLVNTSPPSSEPLKLIPAFWHMSTRQTEIPSVCR